MNDERGNDGGHLFAVHRDLPVAQVQPRNTVEDRRPFCRRQVDGVLAQPAGNRLSLFVELELLRMRERLVVPLVGEDVPQVLPGLIQLFFVVAGGVFPVPHPRRRAGVERAHRHSQVDRGSRAFQTRRRRVARNRHRGVQPPGNRRPAAEKMIEHALPDLANRPAVAVRVAHPERRGQESVALLAANDLVLKRVPGCQKRAKLLTRLLRQVRDERFCVHGAPIHVLRAEERTVLLQDVGTNLNR